MPVIFSDNFNAYRGAGLNPTGTGGALASNSYRMVGFSDGAGTYGQTAASNTDFGRGVAGTDPTTAGAYAALISGSDYGIIFQPTAAEFDSNGYLEARIQNTSGSLATGLTIDFNWLYRNNADRAQALTLQYSTDGVTFTAISAAAFTTPQALTSGAVFTEVARSLELSGLNLGAGDFLYLRFINNAGGGSGSRDEVGIDDLVVTTVGGGPVGNSVSIADVSVQEGNDGTSLMTFTVTRTGGTDAFTVDYATATPGTGNVATPGVDYVATNGTLTFGAGVNTQTFTVTINGDTTVETDEILNAVLSNATGGVTISRATAVGTIQNDDVGTTPIYTIQGATHISPFNGQTVTTTGVVTGVAANGYYLQDRNGDGDTRTSDGVFVFTNSAPTVQVGNELRITGTVSEFRSTTAYLSLTEIINVTNTVVMTPSVALPTAVVLGDGPGQYSPPKVLLGDSDTTGVFDPATQGTDFYETLEGMLVTVPSAVSTSAYKNSFGEIWVRSEAITSNSLNSRGGLTISDTTPEIAQPANKVFDFNPERIKVNDTLASLPTISGVGDRFGDLTGVMSYNFGSYELLPTANVSVQQASGLQKETTGITANLDAIRVASFNVRNLSPVGTQDGEGSDGSTAAELTARARAIVDRLGSPEIIALQELQDNSGTANDGVVDASLTLQQLIDAIVAVGGPRYMAIDSDPVNNTEGGAQSGNIRVAYLFNPQAVTPTAANGLTPNATRPDVLEFPTANRIGNGDSNFDATRKSVPIEWTPVGYTASNGGTFTTINNHFSSKGGSATLTGTDLGNPLYGEPVNSGAVKREGQAIAVNNYVDGLLNDGNPNNDRIIVLGDLNDFQFFPVVQLVTGAVTRTTVGAGNTDSTFTPGTAVLTSLAEQLPVTERYSYNFEGNAQELDHILVSNNIYGTTTFDVVHINSEFADQISDHDPSVASISLPRAVVLATSGNDVIDQAAFTATFGATRGSLAGADTLWGNAGNDRISGEAGNDTLYGDEPTTGAGSAGDDVLTGGGGNDTLYGGGGRDTAAFSGTRADYTLTRLAGGVVQIVDNRAGSPDGTDTLNSIELLQFSDRTVLTTPTLGADFAADGRSDIIFRGTNNTLVVWNGGDPNQSYSPGVISNDFTLYAADFTGDGRTDFLFRGQAYGEVVIWEGGSAANSRLIATVPDYYIVGAGDYNGDGRADILFQGGNGSLITWNGGDPNQSVFHGALGNQWSVENSGDFNGDGADDMLFRNTSTGDLVVWTNGDSNNSRYLGAVGSEYDIATVGDYDGDGRFDLLFRNYNTGDIITWGGADAANSQLRGQLPTFSPLRSGDYNGDGRSDLLIQAGESITIWSGANALNATTVGTVSPSYLVYGGPGDVGLQSAAVAPQPVVELMTEQLALAAPAYAPVVVEAAPVVTAGAALAGGFGDWALELLAA